MDPNSAIQTDTREKRIRSQNSDLDNACLKRVLFAKVLLYVLYIRFTGSPKIYSKCVLHLLGYTANLYLCIWSTDLRYILGHSVPILISVYIGYVYPDHVYFYTVFLYIWLISTCQNPFHWT